MHRDQHESKLKNPKIRKVIWLLAILLFGTVATLKIRNKVRQVAAENTVQVGARSSQPGLVTDTETIEVGDEWIRRRFPPYHEFKLDPSEPILVQLADGREFLMKDGKFFSEEGQQVESLGDEIPGMGISLKSAAPKTKVSVLITVWPK